MIALRLVVLHCRYLINQIVANHARRSVVNKGRLEAFSDGVFAIIITIMVLELAPPEGDTLREL